MQFAIALLAPMQTCLLARISPLWVVTVTLCISQKHMQLLQMRSLISLDTWFLPDSEQLPSTISSYTMLHSCSKVQTNLLTGMAWQCRLQVSARKLLAGGRAGIFQTGIPHWPIIRSFVFFWYKACHCVTPACS